MKLAEFTSIIQAIDSGAQLAEDTDASGARLRVILSNGRSVYLDLSETDGEKIETALKATMAKEPVIAEEHGWVGPDEYCGYRLVRWPERDLPS